MTVSKATRQRNWPVCVLVVAGIYNIAWGLVVVLFPGRTLSWIGTSDLNYPAFWQCVGMIVGVYGVGYLVAASDPNRHWPIVLVGLLGKVFGPIGFVSAATRGDLPWLMGWTILTNDIIWWVPFLILLLRARHQFLRDEAAPRDETVPRLPASEKPANSTSEEPRPSPP